MIVWGGSDTVGFYSATGARYDPVADFWSPTTTEGAPGRTGATAVWTGSKMIVFGGVLNNLAINTGAQYTILSVYVKN
jgi:hypothetical protein